MSAHAYTCVVHCGPVQAFGHVHVLSLAHVPPFSQRSGDTMPTSGQHEPAGQGIGETMLVLGQYEPAGQGTELPKPGSGQYDPVRHGNGSELPYLQNLYGLPITYGGHMFGFGGQ